MHTVRNILILTLVFVHVSYAQMLWKTSGVYPPANIGVSGDGSIVLTADHTNYMRVWNSETCLLSHTYPFKKYLSNGFYWQWGKLAADYNGRYLFAFQDMVHVYDMEQKRHIETISFYDSTSVLFTLRAFAISDTYPWIAVRGALHLKVYDYMQRKMIAIFPDTNYNGLAGIAFVDSMLIARYTGVDGGQEDHGKLVVWNVGNVAKIGSVDIDTRGSEEIVRIPGRTKVAGMSYNEQTMCYNIFMFDPYNMELKATATPVDYTYTDIDASEEYVMTKTGGSVLLYSTQTGEYMETLPYSGVSDMAYSSGTNTLYMISSRAIVECDMNTRRDTVYGRMDGTKIKSVAIDPTDTYVSVVVYSDELMPSYLLATGEYVHDLYNLGFADGGLSAIAYSPDGKYVATGKYDIVDIGTKETESIVPGAMTLPYVQELVMSENNQFVVWSSNNEYAVYDRKDSSLWISEEKTGDYVAKISLSEDHDGALISYYNYFKRRHTACICNLSDPEDDRTHDYGLTLWWKNGYAVAFDSRSHQIKYLKYSNPYDYHYWLFEPYSMVLRDTIVVDAYISKNKKYAVVAYVDGYVECYDLELQTFCWSYDAGMPISEMEWTRDEKRLVLTDEDSKVLAVCDAPYRITSVEEISAPTANAIDVYPNPVVKGQAIDVSFETSARTQVQIEMYNMLGENVWSKNLHVRTAGKYFEKVPSNVKRGLYFIRIRMNAQQYQTKVFVM